MGERITLHFFQSIIRKVVKATLHSAPHNNLTLLVLREGKQKHSIIILLLLLIAAINRILIKENNKSTRRTTTSATQLPMREG
jgi:hypothetical protein